MEGASRSASFVDPSSYFFVVAALSVSLVLRFILDFTFMSPLSIAENLSHITERIAAAAAIAHRQPQEITLIGVSKTHSAEAIRQAYDAGVRHFGENRVQEWEGKRGALADLAATCTFHLIGHLQSNKAARAAKYFDCVESVDDFSLAQKLDRAAAEKSPPGKLSVLIEVHIGGEETKSGVSETGLTRLAEQVQALPHLSLQGLMCIPPLADNPEEARPYFAQLRSLREKLQSQLHVTLPVLSMGMSHDFEIAIQEGSTEVRIGTALFGTRPAA
jgi:pyridoxal phosphate enzyme (YggS family)